MLIPCIQLMDGKAVQVRQGKEKVGEREDVVALAERFGRVGEVAVIDLDAAMGRGDNEDLIREVCKVARCRVGGGIRSEDKARRLLRAGASKIIVGTLASRDFLSRLPRHRVIAAVDSFHGEVVTEGWTNRTNRSPIEEMQVLASYASGFLCTFVERQGTLEGIPLERAKELKKATTLPVAVAGGCKSVEEVVALDRLGLDVHVGTALYAGLMSEVDAFVACLDFSKGPIPTVVQDRRGQVLMLAYSTYESVKRALYEGRGVYWSRSEEALWPKDSSGQRLIMAQPSCTRDALLFLVEERGKACHRNTYSCFGGGDKEFSLQSLFEVIVERRDNRVLGSYTSFLFEREDRIPRKIHEEVYELLTAKNKEDVVWEAADVIYFLLAYLAQKGVTLDDVVRELSGRER